MHGYYSGERVLPTYGAFRDATQLAAYERQRRRFFTDKLHLPPRTFTGGRLIEFGPDSGENSLVFALWGAQCTLVEPHEKAHPFIRDYFDRFGLDSSLAALEPGDIESFPAPSERYDVLDAEGFIYTIQPSSLWIDRLASFVADDGLVVLQYVEAFGSFLELIWKVVQARYRALTGDDADTAARTLFAVKWASIPHKRSIESWTMDVLENPFVRLRYFLEPIDLVEQLGAAGFRLYASWPQYDAGLDVHWSKHEPSAEEQLASIREHVHRSRLSHMLGRKHFLADGDCVSDEELLATLVDVDSLVDRFDDQTAARVDAALGRLVPLLASPAVIGGAEDTRRSLATLEMVRHLLEALARGDADQIAAFCSRDSAFTESWGMPSHFAVFRNAASPDRSAP